MTDDERAALATGLRRQDACPMRRCQMVRARDATATRRNRDDLARCAANGAPRAPHVQRPWRGGGAAWVERAA